VVIELCALLPYLYRKQLLGKSYCVNVNPGTQRMCCGYSFFFFIHSLTSPANTTQKIPHHEINYNYDTVG